MTLFDLPAFARRSRQDEWMDDFSIDDERLTVALDHLRLVNRYLGGYAATLVAIGPYLRREAVHRTVTILHVRHVSREPNSTFRPGQEGVEFKPFAQPLAEEAVITKSVANAFIGTGLEDWLRERRIESVIIVGVITNNSVEATARMAGDLGFDTIVVADATFTFGKADYEGRERTSVASDASR